MSNMIIRLSGIPDVTTYTAAFYKTRSSIVSIPLSEVSPGTYEGEVPPEIGDETYLVIFNNDGKEVARAYYDRDAEGVLVALDADTILLLLGYHSSSVVRKKVIGTDLPTVYSTYVAKVMNQLKILDTSIAEALSDSAITQTCKTQMNWPHHIKMLRQQGHSLLLELARIYDVELAHSKYASYLGRVPYSVQYQ